MQTSKQFDLVRLAQFGLISGFVLLYFALVGMVEAFESRDVIYKTLSLGLALIFTTNFAFGYLAARRQGDGRWVPALGASLLVGVIGSTMLGVLALMIEPLEMRNVLVNASPGLVEILTFGQESALTGVLMLIGIGTGLSLFGAVIAMLPQLVRHALIVGLVMVLAVGTLEELISDVVVNTFEFFFNAKDLGKDFNDIFFAKEGLSVQGAAIVFVLTAGINFLWGWRNSALKARIEALPTRTRQILAIAIMVLGVLLLAVLPNLLGTYLSEILVIVGIYMIMGFGLNIVVGFAGLLDLGYVAFFAIGAYTMGLLTSIQLPQTTEMSGMQINFWVALPIAIGVSVLWGVMLGVPVLRMRGDYLAIVTLGFGEIIRVLALSNWLQPYIGGAQGILGIPKPTIFNFEFSGPQQLYYLVFVGALLAAFISWRLRDSRAGRNWMALREDEDVAEAMGINLIKTKLLAFAVGAGLSGLAGAIFAAKLGSIYPHTFNLLISVNVLSVVIVGGIGSLPGVVVGALVLVGLPELLREFTEFRLLIFGALLVIMMLVKPEGLWPAAAQRRELHSNDDDEVESHLNPETA